MPHADFIHLHWHTGYSLLDGAYRLEKLAVRFEAQLRVVLRSGGGHEP